MGESSTTGSSAAQTLGAEDAKLVTLACGARARVGAVGGAAVRDETGRTYASANVALPSLSLSALALAVAQAAASGARGAEAAAVAGPDPDEADLAAFRDLAGPGVAVIVCQPDGTIRSQLRT